jgi:hypothetical protein
MLCHALFHEAGFPIDVSIEAGILLRELENGAGPTHLFAVLNLNQDCRHGADAELRQELPHTSDAAQGLAGPSHFHGVMSTSAHRTGDARPCPVRARSHTGRAVCRVVHSTSISWRNTAQRLSKYSHGMSTCHGVRLHRHTQARL